MAVRGWGFRTVLGLVGLWGVAVVELQAGTVVWTGGQGGPSAVWSWKNNWSTTNHSEPLTGDHLVFAGTNKLINTNDLTAGISFAGILFDTNAGAFVLNGNGISLAGGVTNSSTNLQT